MTKRTACLSVILSTLGGAYLLGIFMWMTPGPPSSSNAWGVLEGDRSEELPPANEESKSGLRGRAEDSALTGSDSEIDRRAREAYDHQTPTPLQVYDKSVGHRNAQFGQNPPDSSSLGRETSFLANQEPQITKVLAVIEGDGSNFVLTPEQLGISVAGDILNNEMTLRNRLADEQAKLNALAQLTGVYREKNREIAFLQEVAGNLSQPEAVRVGAFLKLADFGSSFVSNFTQSTDEALQMELELLRSLEKHGKEKGIPEGGSRARINP